MSQRRGLHSILNIPIAYNFVQWAFYHKETARQWEELIGDFENLNILDVGCGPGEDVKKYTGGNYIGIDVSEAYISEANQRFAGLGRFICCPIEDIGNLNLKNLDIVTLKGVFHHLEDRQIHDFFEVIKLILNPNGRILSLDPVFSERQNLISKAFVSLDRGKHVRSVEQYQNLVPEGFNISRSNVISQSFPPYDRFIMKVELES